MTIVAYHLDDVGIRAVVTDLGLEKFSGPDDPGFPPTADPVGFDAVTAAAAYPLTDGVAEERLIVELVDALAALLAMNDKMDLPPHAGGGVFPVDKATTMYAARTALAKARARP